MSYYSRIILNHFTINYFQNYSGIIDAYLKLATVGLIIVWMVLTAKLSVKLKSAGRRQSNMLKNFPKMTLRISQFFTYMLPIMLVFCSNMSNTDVKFNT